MKTLKLLLLSVILALGTVQPASADRGHRGYDRHHHGHRYDHHRYYNHHRPHHHHYHRHRSNWGDAATAAIIIGAIGAATYGAFNQPEVHVAPPPPAYVPPPQPQNRYWYYCASSRQYYPYVNYCPEGWQQVLP